MGSTTRSRLLALAMTATATLALSTGCGAAKEAEAPAIPVDGVGATTTAAGGAAPSQSPTAGANPGPTTASKALGSADATLDGARIHLVVTGLSRGAGDLVTAKFDITGGVEDYYALSLFGNGNTLDGVYLVDPVGQKKYLVVEDTEGSCLCSKTDTVRPDETSSWYATFPPLPTSVKAMNVVFPGFTPFENVPLGS